MQPSKLFRVLLFITLFFLGPGQISGKGLVLVLNGNELSSEDHNKIQNACEYSRSGEVTSWHNSGSGNRYSMIPQPAFLQQSTDMPCRKAELQAVSNNTTEQITIIFCRETDGSWSIQDISSRKITRQGKQPATRQKASPSLPPSGHRWSKPK